MIEIVQFGVGQVGDKIWKVRVMTQKLKASFKSFMPHPNEHLSADEAMILFGGKRCPIIRAMPNKPIDRGMKLYVLVDYESKYAACYFIDSAYGATVKEDDMLRKQADGKKTPYSVTRGISYYNKYMGGVDQVDQIRTGAYGVDSNYRMMKWTFRLYLAYFGLAMANAYNIHCYNVLN